MTPRATYRIQLNASFGFSDVEKYAGYLARLGVSHVYTSPYMRARAGSTHGYDVVDPTVLNPELGTASDYDSMSRALKRHGLGQILDFVPNHMGIGGAENPWWLQLLEWGSQSTYASYFDVDWKRGIDHFVGRTLTPVLGKPYGEALETGDLVLRFEAETGEFAVWAHESHKLPICPRDYGIILGTSKPELAHIGREFAELAATDTLDIDRIGILKTGLAALLRDREDLKSKVNDSLATLNGMPGDLSSFASLHRLMDQQHWRVASAQVAANDINYRRFFTINDLVGLKIERQDVFDTVHSLVLPLLKDGTIDGLRIDHVDGLREPRRYLERLRASVEGPFYLTVEKILARHETIPGDWPVSGTTGYDFIALVGGLSIDPTGKEPLTSLYRDFTGTMQDFADIALACKRLIIEDEMLGELHSLGLALIRIARQHPQSYDITQEALEVALKELVTQLEIYRVYIENDQIAPADRREISDAVSRVTLSGRRVDTAALNFIHRLICLELPSAFAGGYADADVQNFIARFQQYTGPVMAKGVEDTAFYRYNRLVCLNEVGGDPAHFGTSIAEFHAANRARLAEFPATMLASATHDTKRGEDARARLAVLSECPAKWAEQVQLWRVALEKTGHMIDPADLYLFFQLLVSGWTEEQDLPERLTAAMIKSLREARLRTTWATPAQDYEETVTSFIRAALDRSGPNEFLDALMPFQAQIAYSGMLNSLTQTALKLTVPGIPDLYQGCELWDYSYVDPDNRRAVDYGRRDEMLREIENWNGQPSDGALGDLLANWQTGQIKLALIHALLSIRQARPALFETGSYQDLPVSGPGSNHLCAFLREAGDEKLIVATPVLRAELAEKGGWGETRLILPDGVWRDVITGKTRTLRAGEIAADELLSDFPVAVLLATANSR